MLIQVFLKKFQQGDCIIVLKVVGAEEQCHVAPMSRVQKYLPGAGVFFQFGVVAAAEFVPLCGVMPEPASQSIARRSFLHPPVHAQLLFSNAPRPKTLHEKTAAVSRISRIIDTLEPDHECLRNGPP